MERLNFNSILIVLLIVVNLFLVYSINSQESRSLGQDNLTQDNLNQDNLIQDNNELAEFRDQISAQLMLVESEIQTLQQQIVDLSNMKMVLAQTKSGDETSKITEKTDEEYLSFVNIQVQSIIDSGEINAADAIEIEKMLSQLDSESLEAVMSQIAVAINNQGLKVERGVIF